LLWKQEKRHIEEIVVDILGQLNKVQLCTMKSPHFFSLWSYYTRSHCGHSTGAIWRRDSLHKGRGKKKEENKLCIY